MALGALGRLQALLLLVSVLTACQPAAPPPAFLSLGEKNSEEADPNHLLVELQNRAALLDLAISGAPAFSFFAPQKGAGADEETGGIYMLGGTALRLLRPIAKSTADDPASGPIYLFELPAEMALRDGLARVAADPHVRRVELDHIRHAADLPNDLFFPEQWNLRAIRAPAAWNISQGSEKVVVAILDTGIIFEHPDLESRLVPGYDFISTPDSADDGDNRRDPDPTDTGTVETSRLHGTHVAGIVGAVTDNRLGIAGVDRRCRLMPVRVLGVHGGDGLDSDIADAVRWASGIEVGKLPPPTQPADVLNLSFGGPTISFTLQRAINEALAHGVIVVAAAGNGAVDTRTYSPGGLDGVITVGASIENGGRASYSNYGPRVDLLAPGGGDGFTNVGTSSGILSTYRDDGMSDRLAPAPYTYSELAGTSQAAPHVAGAAALARALWPEMRQTAFSALLAGSADAKYRCDRDLQQGCGAGLLDVEALLKLVRTQRDCGCQGDTVCLDGQQCAAPLPLHSPLFVENTVYGGWCQIGRGLGARGGASKDLWSGGGLWLASLGLLGAVVAAARRRRREVLWKEMK